MPIQGLDHINIHTSKREETLRFYTEMLDFQEGIQAAFWFSGSLALCRRTSGNSSGGLWRSAWRHQESGGSCCIWGSGFWTNLQSIGCRRISLQNSGCPRNENSTDLPGRPERSQTRVKFQWKLNGGFWSPAIRLPRGNEGRVSVSRFSVPKYRPIRMGRQPSRCS